MTSFFIVRYCVLLAVPVVYLYLRMKNPNESVAGVKYFFHFCNIHVTFSEYNIKSEGDNYAHFSMGHRERFASKNGK